VEKQNAKGTRLDSKDRFYTSVATQMGGLVLLVVLGVLIFPMPPDPKVVAGLQYIQIAIGIYLLGFTIGICLPFLRAWWKQRSEIYEDFSVDLSIWIFAGFDIAILLFLVCQEDGLCRSMFLPVFLLIPAGYFVVERDDKKRRVLAVVGMILMGMIISYFMSDSKILVWSWLPLIIMWVEILFVFIMLALRRITNPLRISAITVSLVACTSFISYFSREGRFLREGQPSSINIPFTGWDIPFTLPLTNFHADSHKEFDKALFAVSLISVSIPFLQVLVIMFRSRVIKEIENPPEVIKEITFLILLE
jgi:hypothetical protein